MLKKLLAVAAVAGMALGSVSAQANTRASAAGVAMAALPQAGTADNDDTFWYDDSLGHRHFRRSWLLAFFGAAAVGIIALIEASGGVVEDDPVSPGT